LVVRSDKGLGPLTHVGLGHRFVAGRGFAPGERDVAVVNEAFANERLEGSSPVGRRLTVFEGQQPPRDLVIVGVVTGGWTRAYLEGSPRAGSARLLFVPLGDSYSGNLTVYARSPQAGAIGPAFKELLARAAPGALTTSPGTMGDLLSRHSLPFVVLGRILSGVSLIALALASLGLFGVVSLFVARRTREFGVRYALGARPAVIRQIVLRDAARISALGVLAGVALSIPVFFVMRANFVGVRPWDPLATAVGVGAMVLATVVASLWPARRASAIDPLAALRE